MSTSRWMGESFMRCHHCGELPDGGMDQRVLDIYDAICDSLGFAPNPNCCYRCPSHNAEVGGAAHSYHMLGMAIDIDASEVEGGVDALGELARSINPDGGVIEYHGSCFVHVDCRDDGAYHAVND